MSALISCLTNSYGRFGAQAGIEQMAAAGIHHVELPIRTAGVDSPFGDQPFVTTAATLDDLKDADQLLQRHGVSASSCNVSSGNPLDPEVVAITQRKLDLAKHFGVSLVVGGAGEASSPEELETLHGNLREIGDHAGRLGITYCFETHPGICQHHRGMLDTMQALDHPHLKLNFDTANILYYNENVVSETALAKVCHHVRHIHLKDSQGDFGKWYFPALGRGGAVDFVRVLQLMTTCGFTGPYSLEIEGIAGEGDLPLEAYQQRIVESVEHLRTCGYFD
ncbi:MAG: sugar phosphate isomerase/epimerase [Planctomycetaceae bacterium]|jgi:L-ribulose-5-phosphate 3-epimerase|nr:sugar phosphate isomerase/epimerase [Planctomycetaceae bacterium]MBT6486080.1 sugar phosphate isomerase/epimerase [Planctomycetaceae bacterium]MBT6496492.1 sugar phosphate isomerase/epimerase [Planctomycetaceae bacterium]